MACYITVNGKTSEWYDQLAYVPSKGNGVPGLKKTETGFCITAQMSKTAMSDDLTYMNSKRSCSSSFLNFKYLASSL